ncbi:MAG: SCO family protein, partial [Rhizomicrobium sp.]
MSIPCYLASMIFQRFVALCLLALLAACGRSGTNWHATDITGALPALDFSLRRASDGTPVHASDYRGKIVVLYFGYTHCPDICPATLANLADAIQKLGSRANEVRVLFVTVDPN